MLGQPLLHGGVLVRGVVVGDHVEANDRERIRGCAAEVDALKEIISTRDVAHWEQVLPAVRVPASRVRQMEAMLAGEHSQRRGVLRRFHGSSGLLLG